MLTFSTTIDSLEKLFGERYDNPKQLECAIHGTYYQRFSINVPKCPQCIREEEEEFESHVQECKNKYHSICNFYDALANNKLHTGCNFSNYNVTPKNLEMFNTCSNFSKNINDGRGLLLLGNSGSGKTHLAISILKNFIFKDANNGKYVKLYQLVNISKNREEYEKLLNCGLLIIDEIGIGETSYARDILYQTIDYRYDNILSVILISNMPATEFFNTNSSALNSRLNENYSKVIVQCEDYRSNPDNSKPMPVTKEQMIDKLLNKYDANIIKAARI